jgi:predicted enzyme related to lactoylglutathione lyase
VANHLSHFAVCVEDTSRARAFYERVFGWGFEPYGPPGFYIVHTDGPGKGGRVNGAMQKSFEIVPGVKLSGFECTISVPDIDATVAAIKKSGGEILMPKASIPSVGTLVRFRDTEGNVVCAMQYDDPNC